MQAYRAALRMLTVRRRTTKELQQALERKGFATGAIQETVERLGQQGLIDDAQFARDWACARVPNRLWGRERVRQELLAKGIGMEHIAQAIAEVYSEYPEEKLADRAARRRWHGASGDGSLRGRQRLGSFLQRQGFPFEIIIKVLDGLKDE